MKGAVVISPQTNSATTTHRFSSKCDVLSVMQLAMGKHETHARLPFGMMAQVCRSSRVFTIAG